MTTDFDRMVRVLNKLDIGYEIDNDITNGYQWITLNNSCQSVCGDNGVSIRITFVSGRYLTTVLEYDYES